MTRGHVLASAGAVLAAAHALPAAAQPLPALRPWLGVESVASGGAGVALTFDDGPHPEGTPAILRTLAEHGAHATFFLVGEQVARHPALAAEIAAAGHAVGVHGDRHRNLLRLAPRQVRADLERGSARIATATGTTPTAYRPPYGVLSTAALLHARRRGWRVLLWSHWGRDWERRATAATVTARATDGLRAGSVVLLHDADYYSSAGSWRTTAAALPGILAEIAARGLPVVAA